MHVIVHILTAHARRTHDIEVAATKTKEEDTRSETISIPRGTIYEVFSLVYFSVTYVHTWYPHLCVMYMCTNKT